MAENKATSTLTLENATIELTNTLQIITLVC